MGVNLGAEFLPPSESNWLVRQWVGWTLGWVLKPAGDISTLFIIYIFAFVIKLNS